MKRAAAKTLRAVAISALAALALVIVPSVATAAPAPKTLWQSCPTGSDAGQCQFPRGIAADPITGHLYVADQEGRRIVELTAWGEFVKAWGWGVLDGSPELQTCATATGCVKGLTGSGPGEFGGFGPQGIALDSAGNVYVEDFSNDRVEKFDPTAGSLEEEADFLLAFGSEGTGNGQFSWEGIPSSFIDVGPEDIVYVGDQKRMQTFDTGGNYLGSISLSGEKAQALSVDSAGKLYLALFKDSVGGGHSKEEVLKLDPAKPDPFGEPMCTAKVPNAQALATDEDDNLYVVDGRKDFTSQGPVEMQIRKFDSGCKEVQDGQFPFADGFDRSTGIATNTVTTAGGIGLYVSDFFGADYVRAYYPPPDKWPPPLVAPTIEDQFATAVDTDSAIVKAKINPNFWADTSYSVEYGTEECSLGGCQGKPLPPGLQLGAGIVSEGVTTPPLVVSGLAPATTYHYRFIAQSGGGGPTVGPEETFTTFPAASLPSNPCPNASFREGAGARLPECRAYEMVSPIDKNNGGIEVLERNYLSGFGDRGPARLDQATPQGEAITYSATRAFAGALSAPWSSQYIAKRDSLKGWSTESINPPRGNVALNGEAITEIPFSAFSEDLCSAWVLQDTELTLTPGAPTEAPNTYRRRNCGGAPYELLTPVDPPGFSFEEAPNNYYYSEVQGATQGGTRSVLRANAPLTEDAASKEKFFQLYETSEGPSPGESAELRLLSVLPNGEAAVGVHSSLGTAAGENGEFRSDSVHNAISQDGSRVFWTVNTVPGVKIPSPSGGKSLQSGNLYLRANPLAPQSESGQCDEVGKACTLAIAGPSAEFWTADQSGSLVIYQSGAKLFEAQIEEEGEELTSTSTLIAEGVDGVTGWSEDATKVYFVSSKALAPGAVEGRPNLYFHEKGQGFELLGTLSSLDVSHFDYPSLDNIRPGFRLSRVSADGLRAVFSSRAPLTGFDNTDAVSGEPDAEVFLYEADETGGEGEPRCVSCNSSEARPAGRELGREIGIKDPFWAAAQIPRWETQQYASRVLSANGNRLFFESFDALLPSDTNGAKDLYVWQRAGSQAQCEAKGSPLFVKDSGGCLSLISSGESPHDSEFIDASFDGRDVFFTTAQSLFSEDPGSVDLYDARIGGGFAPKPKVAPCQGEACQSPATAPDDRTPASASFHGASGKSKPRGCPKGKRRTRKAGKARCVKAKQQRTERQRKQKRNHEQRRNNR
jgi:DNA-binding beta-propeller fold protein YncE